MLLPPKLIQVRISATAAREGHRQRSCCTASARLRGDHPGYAMWPEAAGRLGRRNGEAFGYPASFARSRNRVGRYHYRLNIP